MRLLFELDYHTYKENGTVFKRPSARGIIIKDKKVAMVYSKKCDYYKFPGGGINKNENAIEALIREVQEESGLNAIKESIKEYGLVVRKDLGKEADMFYQENFYYLLDVDDEISKQTLDEYEAYEDFKLVWIDPLTVIDTNLHHNHSNKYNARDNHEFEREVAVIRKLMDEGYFD